MYIRSLNSFALCVFTTLSCGSCFLASVFLQLNARAPLKASLFIRQSNEGRTPTNDLSRFVDKKNRPTLLPSNKEVRTVYNEMRRHFYAVLAWWNSLFRVITRGFADVSYPWENLRNRKSPYACKVRGESWRRSEFENARRRDREMEAYLRVYPSTALAEGSWARALDKRGSFTLFSPRERCVSVCMYMCMRGNIVIPDTITRYFRPTTINPIMLRHIDFTEPKQIYKRYRFPTSVRDI